MSYIIGGLTLPVTGEAITQASISDNFEKVVSTSAAAAPGPLAASLPPTGQLWYDTTNSLVKVNTGTPAAPVWTAISNVTAGLITGTAAQDYQKAAVIPTLRADGVASLVEGDMWYDTATDSLKIWNGTAWIATSASTGIISGTAAQDYQKGATTPTLRADGVASLVEGDMWYDTSINTLLIWDGAAWVATGSITGIVSGTAAQDYQKGTATPTLRADGVAALVEGDLWYDTATDSVYIWNGTAWIATGPRTGLITGTAAQDYQKGATTPTLRADGVAALVEGDMWYDTATNTLQIWDGAAWIATGSITGIVSGTAAQDYQKKATTPTTRADGVASLVEGDMWYDTATNTLQIWDGAAWIATASTTGVITGTAAQDYQKGTATPTLRAGGGALVEGDLWYDTTNDALKVWNGTSWPASGAGPTTGVITGTAAYDYQVAALAPTLRSGGGALVDGDLWFDTTANVFKTRKTGAWLTPPTAPTTGVITGTAAQDYQKGTATPTTRVSGTALVEGDLWYDTTNDALKVWNGTTWPASGAAPTTGVITGTAAYDYQVAALAPTVRSGGGALVDGDLWFDTTANVFKTRKTGAWVSPAVAPTTGLITGTAAQDYQKGTATPTLRADGVASLVEGDLWYDTTNDSLKVYDGAAWDAPAPPPTTGVITGTAAYDYQVAALAPTVRSGGGALVDGDLWFDTTANVFKTRKTGAWVSPPTAPTTGVITGTAAQDYQVAATAPTTRSVAGLSGALVDGDLWYDTSNNTMMIRKSGAWVNAMGGGGAAVTANPTYVQVFSGNAGDQWYDLAQHGIGLYEVTWYMAQAQPYWTQFFVYDGISNYATYATASDNNGDLTSSAPGNVAVGKKHSQAGWRAPVRYIGSKGTAGTLAATALKSSADGLTQAGVDAVVAAGMSYTSVVPLYIVRVRKVTQ